MAKRIVAALPQHKEYVEPFCGSAAVLFAKPRVAWETVSDLNPWPISALRAIRDCPDDLLEALPQSIGGEDWRRTVIDIRNGDLSGNPIKDAVTMMIGWKSSFNQSPWQASMSRRECDRWASDWESGKTEKRIRAGFERLQGVRILHGDALDVMRQYVKNDTLFFLDPPYMRMEHGGGSRGGAHAGYGPEYDPGLEFHTALAQMLVDRKDDAMFVLTTGDDEMYKSALGGAGYGFLGGFGDDGNAVGHGHAAKAGHLIWSNAEGRGSQRPYGSGVSPTQESG